MWTLTWKKRAMIHKWIYPELNDESEVDNVLGEDLGGHNDDVMEVVLSQGTESSQSQSEFEPETDSASQDEACESQTETGSKQRVLIVYEEKLRELMRFCPRCGAPVESENTVEVKNEGSQLSLHLKCVNNCEYKWQSQPSLADIKGAGNLLFTTGIYFSGIPFAKFESFSKLINLKFFGEGTYFTLRQQYVFPVIKSTWTEQQAEVPTDLKSRGGEVVLVGDGRCDSPGHCAKYCTYTLLDVKSKKVVDFKVVSVTEVGNSNQMEKEKERLC